MTTVTPASVREEAETWFRANWDPEVPLGRWWERLADSGWGFPTWPERWFGRSLSSDQAKQADAARAAIGAVGPPSGIGVMMAGPTIIDHGTEEQCQRFLPNMVCGKEVWCQLFSEPGAGSDLAGLQARAERDGDEWVVNGQKVWTSGAQFSKWGILIARTSVDVPKHEGITFFVIDMDQAGVEVRPLKEMTGGATFNEVFMTDARVPHSNVIAEPNRGWGVAVTTLAHERNSLGASGMASAAGGLMIGRNDLDRPAGRRSSGGGGMTGMAAAFGGGGSMVAGLPALVGRGDDKVLRDKVMRIYTLMEITRYTSLRVQAARDAGRGPGPEVSTGKLVASELVRQLRDVGLEALGPHGQLMGDDTPLGGMLQQLALFSPAISIAGGSDQIQRNIIGERVLGLPGEPRADKDVPFAELKVGTQR